MNRTSNSVSAIDLVTYQHVIVLSLINPYRVDASEENIQMSNLHEGQSFFEMLGEYILAGFKVAIIVAAMLIGFIALIAALNALFINTGIFIPPGKTLHILGSLRGNGRGRFVLQDGSQVTGEEGGSMHNITLDVRGSDCTIKGLAMSGFGPVTQIYIGGKNKRVMRNLTIDNLTVSHANYAILRQGFHNQIIGANITNCKFSDLQGDGQSVCAIRFTAWWRRGRTKSKSLAG